MIKYNSLSVCAKSGNFLFFCEKLTILVWCDMKKSNFRFDIVRSRQSPTLSAKLQYLLEIFPSSILKLIKIWPWHLALKFRVGRFRVQKMFEQTNGRFSIGKNDQIQFSECVREVRELFIFCRKLKILVWCDMKKSNFRFDIVRSRRSPTLSAKLQYLLAIFPSSIFKLVKMWHRLIGFEVSGRATSGAKNVRTDERELFHRQEWSNTILWVCARSPETFYFLSKIDDFGVMHHEKIKFSTRYL